VPYHKEILKNYKKSSVETSMNWSGWHSNHENRIPCFYFCM